MGAEDVVRVPGKVDSSSIDEKGEFNECDAGPSDAGCVHSEIKGNGRSRDGDEFIGLNKDDLGSEEGEILSEEELSGENDIEGSECSGLNLNDNGTGQEGPGNLIMNGEIGTDNGNDDEDVAVDMDLVDSPMEVRIEVVDTVTLAENLLSGDNNGTNCINVEKESIISSETRDLSCVSGVKRLRSTYEKEQPSVHVKYNSLTRASKKKLEELLQQWSEWHAEHDISSQMGEEGLESGEDTYFPALFISTRKSSSVSFWIENQASKHQTDCFTSLDDNTVPLYDRGFALGLTSTDGLNNVESDLKVMDEASRCFNCGSYNHSFRECPKPRDNVAVSSARKQHMAKKNQNASSRNSIRYYQMSSGGKYDGLKPGTLDAETRKALGLKELDPPPWLHRMRQLGYPPGYLDIDDENQPSGITIFSDEDVKGQEDGEIVGEDNVELKKIKTVEFPGINAPIPENADPWLWAVTPSVMDVSTNIGHHRSNHSQSISGRNYHHRERGSRNRSYEGPPGVDSECSPSFPSYHHRYGMNDPFNTSDSRTDARSRSYSDTGKRSASTYEDSVSNSSYSSPYFSKKRPLPHVHAPGRYESDNDRWNSHSRGRDSLSRLRDDENDLHSPRSRW